VPPLQPTAPPLSEYDHAVQAQDWPAAIQAAEVKAMLEMIAK
jgi:hypothetical protein